MRLRQGALDRATVYPTRPAEAAARFAAEGASLIHVVDLDGAALGKPQNLEALGEIRRAVKCRLEVSGGLRSLEAVGRALDAGADYVSVASAALTEPGFLAAACRRHAGRVFASLDLRAGRPAVKGWVEMAALSVEQALERFGAAGAAAVIVTDIDRDGMEAGTNSELLEGIARQAGGVAVIASGGVAGLDDIRQLSRLAAIGVRGVIVGRALYEGRFTLAQALAEAACASGS